MSNKFLTLTFLMFSTFVYTTSYAQVTITNTISGPTLTNALIGSGVSTSNIIVQSQVGSTATFTNSGTTGFPFSSGIILSTGTLSNANLNNTAIFHNGTDLQMPGSPLIDAIVAPNVSQDAVSLSFSFACASDSVEFEFIFSSEEYNDYVLTSCTDAFGFFVTGPGYLPNTNVAKIPGTNTPISINTVNNGNDLGTASGPCLNCAYYVDNVGTGAVDLSLDGYTVPIKIKLAITPCATYSMKLVIADVCDGVFDSMVFLKGSSFSNIGQVQILVDGVEVSGNLNVCSGGNIVLSAPPSTGQYLWSTGDTTQSIVVTQPGAYQFGMYSGTCFAYSPTITVTQQGTIQTPVITQNGPVLNSSVIPAPGITYQWYLNSTSIPGATQHDYTFQSNGCYRQTIYEGTCQSTSNKVCVTNTAIQESVSSLVSIYPHPVTSQSVMINPFNAGSLTQLSWYDVSGKLVAEDSRVAEREMLLHTEHLKSGIYFLEIRNASFQEVIRKKVIIQ